MRAFEQKLVRHARRNTDNVSGGNFLAYPALDRAVALFMRPYSSPFTRMPPTTRVAEPDCTKKTSAWVSCHSAWPSASR
jgi:hypothetical protein